MFDNMDMNDLIEKAKKVQENILKQKEEASKKTKEISVGGGMVNITINGSLEFLSVKLDPEIVDRDDVETLEDLIRAAANEAIRQGKDLGVSDISDMISNFKLP